MTKLHSKIELLAVIGSFVVLVVESRFATDRMMAGSALFIAGIAYMRSLMR